MSSVLQPVDVNVDRSPARKRARYDDDVDELNKSGRWSLNENDVVLHDLYDTGVGRLDSDMAEVTDDEAVLSRSGSGSIDISCASITPSGKTNKIDLLDSTYTEKSLDRLSLAEWDNLLIPRPVIQPTDKTNYFNLLSDEVILYIFKWLPKVHLMDVSLVSRRFNRLSQDESLWTRMDVSNKYLQAEELGHILSKQVIVLRLARSEICHPPIGFHSKAAAAGFCSRLMYLDLSMAFISTQSLIMLFCVCRRLKKLSLENVPVNNSVLMSLSASEDLEAVNFAMSLGLKAYGLKLLLTDCRRLQELNLAWTYLDADSIKCVCENAPESLDRLNLSGCRKVLTDEHIASLVKSCPRLRELDLSDCTAITGEAVRHITLFKEMHFLALSRCYLIPHKALLQLKKLDNLTYLDIHGGYIDAEDMKVVQEGLGAKVLINQFKFSSVARPTVGYKRSSIWNMRVRD